MARGIYFLVILFVLLMSGVLAECDSGQIDINSALLEELDKIIWVGPATAQKIIDARPFESVEDLIKVSGIGEKKLNAIIEEDLACVEVEAEKNPEIKKRAEKEELKEIVEENKKESFNPRVENPIILVPKDIKTEKKEFNKEKLAKAGLMIVSLILLCVFAFHIQKKWTQKKLEEL